MDTTTLTQIPSLYKTLEDKTMELGFTMPSDPYLGALLKTLVASKPNGLFLELGTGTGLSLSWMLDGLQGDAHIISVDNDPELIAVGEEFFGADTRVKLVCADGGEWIQDYEGPAFDLVFADAWPGKYSHFDALLQHIKVGGFYVVDDMRRQPNWPEGHEEKAARLVEFFDSREDLFLTKIDWSTGLIIAVRTK